ncbi:DUF2652 domain-containing protein [Chryseosolibacter indicus]|uniref:DUF2652 domain-containing protein n=1 Tax=Chryseosolibacter indicus TaxID=2782351 RepID=A0ABS5W0M9_9BACT|nr:DUF2652 domain-containing protein [Chryseosolibacter indicus]MBT1705841.1 DUF2652 domain-containing protein [Chryseosolibacter indicus]
MKHVEIADKLVLVNTSASLFNEGMLIITDISGYTTFVHNTDAVAGKYITYELLSEIINNNTLGLQVSEIEGDAVLFYKTGTPPALPDVLRQYEVMLLAFNSKVEELTSRFGVRIDLTLKLIAHYGSFSEYELSGFRKLYGEAVIEVHRLLKNSLDSHCYVLITNNLFAASEANHHIQIPQAYAINNVCEVYGALGKICYSYFSYEYDSAPKIIV